MKKSFAFVFSMVMVIGLMAMSVLAQPITDIHTHIDTNYQGSSLVDKGLEVALFQFGNVFTELLYLTLIAYDYII